MLRREVAVYQPFLGAKADNNDWAEFLLKGSRESKVHFRGMEAKQPEKVGPYRAVSLAVEVEGTYEELKAFVEWLEKSDRILRLDTVRFEKMPGTVMMKVYVLGLVQKNG